MNPMVPNKTENSDLPSIIKVEMMRTAIELIKSNPDKLKLDPKTFAEMYAFLELIISRSMSIDYTDLGALFPIKDA